MLLLSWLLPSKRHPVPSLAWVMGMLLLTGCAWDRPRMVDDPSLALRLQAHVVDRSEGIAVQVKVHNQSPETLYVCEQPLPLASVKTGPYCFYIGNKTLFILWAVVPKKPNIMEQSPTGGVRLVRLARQESLALGTELKNPVTEQTPYESLFTDESSARWNLIPPSGSPTSRVVDYEITHVVVGVGYWEAETILNCRQTIDESSSELSLHDEAPQEPATLELLSLDAVLEQAKVPRGSLPQAALNKLLASHRTWREPADNVALRYYWERYFTLDETQFVVLSKPLLLSRSIQVGILTAPNATLDEAKPSK